MACEYKRIKTKDDLKEFIAADRKAQPSQWGGVPMFLSTPWGVDVSGFRLAVVGALRPAGGVRRPFPCGPVQATRAGSW